MLKVIIAIVAIILLTIGIVWLIDKFMSKKVKPIVTLVLWGISIFLGYMTFNSFYTEIEFNKLKVERYKVVIDKLNKIKDAEIAYKQVNGEYADKFEKLIRFIDTAQVPITQRRDTSVFDAEKTKLYGGIEYFKTLVLIDTLSYYSVKDSLFKGKDTYKSMMDVTVGQEGAKFKLEAGTLSDIPVFEASVDKAIILFGEDKNLIDKEKQTLSVDGVNGPKLAVGSMSDVTTAGNWPRNFDKKD